MDWLQALGNCTSSNIACVVVMIVNVEGSAPRKAGTRMLVTADDTFDTIGGGALELEGISHARALLAKPQQDDCVTTREFNLGSSLSQCCGGRLSLQFDCHFANDFRIHVFGAGHVAQEVARLVMRLPCAATFHDSRSNWIERIDRQVCNQANLAVHNDQTVGEVINSRQALHRVRAVDTQLLGDNPFAAVEACEAGAYFLIMTHSHDLDLELVEAVLSRGDSRYCGVIASKSKAAKFRNRLKRKGFTEEELSAFTAPLGRHSKTGNTPMEVAIAGLSDILDARQQRVLQPC